MYVAQLLTGLRQLRRLKLYLDFVEPIAEQLRDTALVFAQSLTSLREIIIWDNLRYCHTFHATDGCVRRGQCKRRGIK